MAASELAAAPPPPFANGTSSTTTTTTTTTKTPPPPQCSSSQKHSQTLEALCLDLQARIDRLLSAPTPEDSILRGVQGQVRIANAVVDDALRRYAPHELSLSYNGGKDCLVLLLLILARLPAHFGSSASSTKTMTTTTSSSSSTTTSSSTSDATTTTTPNNNNNRSTFPSSLQALYIRPPKPFPEVDAFVESSSADYHLDLATSDKPMKAALADYLEQRTPIRAVFVGTRRTDPHGGKLTFFDETDRDWPRFMRIHPVIDWHYREIWGFIRALEVPYCPLYDMGYTSLGGTDDTLPNPALKAHEGRPTKTGFRPAYELMDDDEERLGRDK